MEVENLDLDNFDINTHEPPNYNSEMLSIERIDDEAEEDYSSEEEDVEYTDDEGGSEVLDDGDDLEISLNDDGENLDLQDYDNVIYSYPFFTKDEVDYEYRVTITDEELLSNRSNAMITKPISMNVSKFLQRSIVANLSPPLNLFRKISIYEIKPLFFKKESLIIILKILRIKKF